MVQQTSSLCVRHTEEPPLKWIPLGPPLCVWNMEISVIQRLLYTLVGVVMCSQAVGYEEAALSDISMSI